MFRDEVGPKKVECIPHYLSITNKIFEINKVLLILFFFVFVYYFFFGKTELYMSQQNARKTKIYKELAGKRCCKHETELTISLLFLETNQLEDSKTKFSKIMSTKMLSTENQCNPKTPVHQHSRH